MDLRSDDAAAATGSPPVPSSAGACWALMASAGEKNRKTDTVLVLHLGMPRSFIFAIDAHSFNQPPANVLLWFSDEMLNGLVVSLTSVYDWSRP